MDADRVYALLQEALRLLDQAQETAVAAHVSHCMALMRARYESLHDHREAGD